MSYFLKQTKQGSRVFLQISETTYNKTTKKSSNRCHRKIGYLDALVSEEMPDPVAFYKGEADRLNRKRGEQIERDRAAKIGSDPTRNVGYFLVKGMANALELERETDVMKHMSGFPYPIFRLVEALTYSRIVMPCSKLKTYNEVLPHLYEDYDFSLGQIYEGLDFIGSRYPQFIEIMNYCIGRKYPRNTGYSFFDCTNYYFEIDFESGDKQKGPSKENRPNPIVGQALLLDGDAIPMGMRMYPGNESEKPKIRELIKELKETNNIKGKTIQVADKGLNCGDNIYDALLHRDGYIFSQSVLQLEERERKWVLLDDGYEDVRDSEGNVLYRIKACVDEFPIKVTGKEGRKATVNVKQKRVATFNPSLAAKRRMEINRLVEKAMGLCHSQAKKEEYGEASKYVRLVGENGKKANVTINREKIEKDLKYAGYNLLVSSEVSMPKREIYRVYHQLWRIEDTFRILKSQLDARPVYLQNRNRIYGHFLICYYAVTLLRLLEEKAFKGVFSVYELKDVIRGLRVLKGGDRNTNLAVASKNIDKICEMLGVNINHLYLSDREIERLFRYKYRTKK